MLILIVFNAHYAFLWGFYQEDYPSLVRSLEILYRSDIRLFHHPPLA